MVSDWVPQKLHFLFPLSNLSILNFVGDQKLDGGKTWEWGEDIANTSVDHFLYYKGFGDSLECMWNDFAKLFFLLEQSTTLNNLIHQQIVLDIEL